MRNKRIASRCWRFASRYCRIAGVTVAVELMGSRYYRLSPMKVLGLDTTTAAGSVALVDDRRTIEVAAIDPSQPVATRLPGDIAALLERHALALGDIALLAVATGPGSFTGLRIGIATMQGLALAAGKPLIGVSAFEALATFAEAPRVAVWIDAWRGEVYAAAFAAAKDAGLHELAEPVVAPPPD